MGGQIIKAKQTKGFMVDPDELVIIGLDTEDGEQHPLYDASIKKPLNETTVQNIMLNGVLQDVTCRKNGDKLEVVLGRDRARYGREAKKRLLAKGVKEFKIPVKVKRYGSDLEMRLALRSENYHRREIDKIAMAKDMVADQKLGASDEDLMVAYKLPSVQVVKKTLSYLDLDKEVQSSIQSGDISATEALRLVGLSREAQKNEVKKKIVEKAVKKAAKAAGEMPKKAPDKDYVRAVAKWTLMKPDVRAGMLWAIGDITAEEAEAPIVGFVTALKDAGQIREKPKVKSAPKKAAAESKKAEKSESPKKAAEPKATRAEKAEKAATRKW